jgi:hypothetical protein
MKIERTKLIARIDEIEAERKKAVAALNAKRTQGHADALADWKATKQPVLLAELRRVTEIVRKGKPAGKTRLKEDSWGKGSIWAAPDDAPDLTEYVPDASRAALRKILAASTDEHITTSALREIGFRPSQLIG